MKDNNIKDNNITDSNIKSFFDQNKQKIEDNGFSERLFAELSCMPQPTSVVKIEIFKGKYLNKNNIIMFLFILVGFVLFAAFGGYTVIIESLAAAGNVMTDATLITPQFVISMLFILFSLFALGKFAIEAE